MISLHGFIQQFHNYGSPVLCQPSGNDPNSKDFLMEFSVIGGPASRLPLQHRHKPPSHKAIPPVTFKESNIPKNIRVAKAKLSGIMNTQDAGVNMEIACRRLISDAHTQMLATDKKWQPDGIADWRPGIIQ